MTMLLKVPTRSVSGRHPLVWYVTRNVDSITGAATRSSQHRHKAAERRLDGEANTAALVCVCDH